MQKVKFVHNNCLLCTRNGKVVSVKLPKNPPPLPDPGGRDKVRGYENLLKLTPDLSIGTPFQQKVWRYIRKIPYGHTVTYKKIARDLGLGSAWRAVGHACRSNPIPIIIPCHRVVASNGTLGGYSSGVRWKRFLLELEKSRR